LEFKGSLAYRSSLAALKKVL